MTLTEIRERLEICPPVASVHEDRFGRALESTAQIAVSTGTQELWYL